MGCGDSRVVPPSLPRREDDPSEEAVLFEQHDPPGAKIPQIPLEDDLLDEDYAGEFDFITENSDEKLVKKVISEFHPPTNLELVIVGIPCSRLLSAVQRTKLEEAKILESLRNEGLIARPLKNALNATGFEIVENKKENPASKVTFVPQSLRKEDRPEKVVTNEMINEKLAKAEERRKQQEEEKKARAVTSKPRPSRREEEKEELRIMQMEKWEAGIRNRELQLLETQEKLREKHQRIKGVNFKKSFKGMDPFDNDSD